MGPPGARAGTVPPVRAGRIGRHCPAARLGESSERRRDLELSHDRRPDTLHDGSPRHSGPRAASCGRAEIAAACRDLASGGAPTTQTGSAKGFVVVPVEVHRTENSHPNSEKEVVLPHLRFSRDKRGYENTFVVHTHGSTGRRRGKPRSRVLYWFRTPPGVRVGRSALDEDAIRLIEQHNPHIDFDWTRILKSQDGSGDLREQPPEERRPRPRDRDSRPRGQAPAQSSSRGQTPAPTPDEPAVMESPEAAPALSQSIEPLGSANEPVDEAVRDVVAEFLVEPRVEPMSSRPQAGDALSAVERRLGSEGLLRIRARYSEVLARISETVADPARQEELKTTAERLNPDTWVTEAEVQAGLEDYEAVFDSLRSVVGRRRRRSGRSSDSRRNRGVEPTSGDSTGPIDAVQEDDDPGSGEQQ